MKQVIDYVREEMERVEEGLFYSVFPDYQIDYISGLEQQEQMRVIASYLGGEIDTDDLTVWLQVIREEFIPRIN
jgi:hypothetical protein|nr:MAG TPA: hypothetical protein [Caudoviricetes sp.]DAX36912.1 MAG TPA: hypothetical protein [Caudoviricetes sp.]